MYVASNSLSDRNYAYSQVDTNIPDLESKLSFVSLKAVTWPQMISNGHHPENSFETFTRAVISSGHLA